jgi:predicted secreted protein
MLHLRFAAALVLALAAFLGLSALDEGRALASGEKKAKTVTVTVKAKDKDTRVKLDKGDTLEVKLEFQGGTGYSWELAKHDKDRLKLQGKPTTERPEKPRPGGKLAQVFRFSAEAVGESKAEFVYRRPFEKGKPPARTFVLTVEVGSE